MKQINFKKFLKTNLLWLILTFIFFVFVYIGVENSIFYIHFVDEEDNLVLGKYLLQNYKLYSDLFSHHQPLAYILSSFIQGVTDPNSIYLLIKRHREFMIIWSLLWSGLLVWKYGIRAFLFVVIFELTKLPLLGNLFLAESLAAYPLSFIFLETLNYEKLEYKTWELIFLGFCLSIILLLLAPIWPLLLVLVVIFLLKRKFNYKNLLLILGGVAPLVFLSLNYISLSDYFYNAFYINFNYYIPLTTTTEFGGMALLKSFFSPVMALFKTPVVPSLLLIIQSLCLVLIISLLFLIKMKKKLYSLSIFLILGFANIRFIEPGIEYYQGFHILPWYALLILSSISALFLLIRKKERRITLLSIPIVFILFLSIFLSSKTLFLKRDRDYDFYVNYSRQFDIGQAVNIIKSEGDTLFVAPDEWLVFWQADIAPASKMLNYYQWMSKVPELKTIVDDMFTGNKPTFFYYHQEVYGLDGYLSSYEEIKKDGNNTRLFIAPERLHNISKSQKEKLDYLNFNLN